MALKGSCNSPGHSGAKDPPGTLGTSHGKRTSPGQRHECPRGPLPAPAAGVRRDWQNWGGKRGENQRALDKSEKKEHTKGGRRKAELELDPVLPGGAPRLWSRPSSRMRQDHGSVWQCQRWVPAATATRSISYLCQASGGVPSSPVPFPLEFWVPRLCSHVEKPRAVSVHPGGWLQTWQPKEGRGVGTACARRRRDRSPRSD